MRQIPPSETCPDEHTYTIITYQRTGLATIGIFCPDGSVTRVQVLYKGRVSLQVPRDRKLEPLDFKVTVGPEIKSECLAAIGGAIENECLLRSLRSSLLAYIYSVSLY